MHKYTTAILLLALLITVVSCGESQSDDQADHEPTVGEAPDEDMPWEVLTESLPRTAVRVKDIDVGLTFCAAVAMTGDPAC